MAVLYKNCLMMSSFQFITELQNQLGNQSSSKWTSGIVILTADYCKYEIPTENKTNTPFPLRSNQSIERKKAEARAERELAARKREDARRAKDEVKFDNFDEGK